jgi:hypothetical protein
MRVPLAAVLAVAAVVTLGCKGISTPSSNVTDQFSGTLQPKDQKSHPFSVSRTGEFTVKLTAWAPNTNIFAGLVWSLGNNDGSCSTTVLQQNNFVTLNTQALGGAIVSGKYCIFIFDTGTMTAPQTYTISVSHPQ